MGTLACKRMGARVSRPAVCWKDTARLGLDPAISSCQLVGRSSDTGRRERYGSRDLNGGGCGDDGGGRVFGGAARGGDGERVRPITFFQECFKVGLLVFLGWWGLVFLGWWGFVVGLGWWGFVIGQQGDCYTPHTIIRGSHTPNGI